MEAQLQNFCEKKRITAYVDGELDPAAQESFEQHLNICRECRLELRLHRQLVCELDVMLASDTQVTMPVDFSRVVAARAVSDMSGVRTRAENKKALVLCLLLGVTGFGLIGSTSRQAMIDLVPRVFRKVFSLIDLMSHAVYDLTASVAVVFRVLSRKVIIDTGNFGLVLVLLAFAVVLLSRLISGYHRADVIE